MNEQPPIRLSEIIAYMGCPEYARRNVSEPSDGNIYTVGGVAIALAMESQFKGDSRDEDSIAKDALAAAVTEEQRRTGKVWLSAKDAGILVDRIGTVLFHFRTWFPTTGITIVASEVEIRSTHDVERGGRMDFLAMLDGKLGILDGKAFGLFGKSVSAQSVVPDMHEENQCGWYGAILDQGCYGFLDVPNRERHTLTSILRERYAGKYVEIKPEWYGQIQYGHLFPFSRNSYHKDGSIKNAKGDFRGEILFTTPFHNHLIRNADRLAAWYDNARSGPYPSVKRYEGQGKNNCDTCRFRTSCWPTDSTPEPVMEIPDFVKEYM